MLRVDGAAQVVGPLTMLTMLDLSSCDALTGLPDALGQLAALTELNLINCSRLTRLPLSLSFLPSTLRLVPSRYLAFPPLHIARQGMAAVKAFLLMLHHPLKMLLLILAARRRRMRYPPPELWELIRDGFLNNK